MSFNWTHNSQTSYAAVAVISLDPMSMSVFVLLSPQAEDDGLIPDVEFGHALHQPPILKWVAPGRRWWERKQRCKMLGRWDEVGRKWEETKGHDELKKRKNSLSPSQFLYPIWNNLLLKFKLEEFSQVREI